MSIKVQNYTTYIQHKANLVNVVCVVKNIKTLCVFIFNRRRQKNKENGTVSIP